MRRLGSRFSPTVISSPSGGRAVRAQAPASDDVKVEEHVVVTSTRLADKAVPVDEVPASLTIVDRDEIEASGARNLQDLLADEAGVVLIDQVGNDVQKTLDLRGFAGGKGIAVFVDGARVNDPRNNSVALEQFPLDAIERIEITRGPSAALAGGGAEAGVIRVVTRRGTTPAAAVSASAGTWNTQRYDGATAADFGLFDLFVVRHVRHDGRLPDERRRRSDPVQCDRAPSTSAAIGGSRSRSCRRTSTTETRGRSRSPSSNRTRLKTFSTPRLHRRHRAPGVAELSGPDRGWILSGGESGLPRRPGQDADDGSRGPRVRRVLPRRRQRRRGRHRPGDARPRLVAPRDRIGSRSERSGSTATSTAPAISPLRSGTYDPTAPDLAIPRARRNAGLFLQDAWTITPRWTVTAGARGDRSRVDYEESIPGTTPTDDRTFSEVSFHVGATFRPNERVDLYVSYGDAFLPPTPEQLFAFPGFGSNPDLLPEDARAYEVGVRAPRPAGSIEMSLFWTDTSDEIIFDPTPTPPTRSDTT